MQGARKGLTEACREVRRREWSLWATRQMGLCQQPAIDHNFFLCYGPASLMPVPLSQLKELLERNLPGAKVSVTDLVGDGDHLQATVVSEAFIGKSLLEQHQMVYHALGDLLKTELHALKLQTYSPEQWEKKREKKREKKNERH